jgi:hypothetical protein
VRRILLQEVAASNGYFLLIFPGTAQVSHFADEDATRLAVDEQLWNVCLGHPP